MTPRQIAEFCLSLPAATHVVQWEGVSVFKVGGKMFCLFAPDGHSVGRLSFKAPEGLYETMAGAPGFRPAPYLARAGWVAVDRPQDLAPADLRTYLRRAHETVAARLPRRLRRILGFSDPPPAPRPRRRRLDPEAERP